MIAIDDWQFGAVMVRLLKRFLCLIMPIMPIKPIMLQWIAIIALISSWSALGGYNSQVVVFDSRKDDQCVQLIGNTGYNLGEFRQIFCLGFDEFGVLYVCDFDNNRVQVY